MTATGATGRDGAIVLGGSVAGLCAAAALAPRFRAVTIVERDALDDLAAPRRGVPHRDHTQGVLPVGFEAMCALLPGLAGRLVAGGATLIDMGRDLRWFHHGGFKHVQETGLVAALQSRALLEACLRAEVRARFGNVELMDRTTVRGLVWDASGKRVVGVRTTGDSDRTLAAALVVDASGRGSRVRGWLADAGFSPPPSRTLPCDVTYATQVFRDAPGIRDALGARALAVHPTAPAGRRIGVFFPMEGGRWQVSLAGCWGDVPSADPAELMDFAKGLETPLFASLLGAATPEGRLARYRVAASVWHQHERAPHHPGGIVALGDALAIMNPIYAQGMTLAALGARELGVELQRGALDVASPAFAVAYHRRAARWIARAWDTIAVEDLRHPEAGQRVTPPYQALQQYVARMHVAAHQDPAVARRFLEVMNLARPASAALTPPMMMRVLWATQRPAS